MKEIFQYISNNYLSFIRIFLFLFVLIIFLSRVKSFKGKGNKLIRLNEYGQALEFFLDCLNTKKTDFLIHFKIAYCYYMLGFNENAIKYFESSLSFNNKNNFERVEANLILALLHAEGNKIEIMKKSYDFLAKGMEAQKRNIFFMRLPNFYYFEMISWVFLKNKDNENFKKYFPKAVKKNKRYTKRTVKIKIERFAASFFRMGVMLVKEKEYSLAKQYLKNAIRLAPNSVFATQAQDEIKKMDEKK